MKYTFNFFLNLIILLSFVSVNAQNSYWQKTHPSKIEIKGEQHIKATKFACFELNIENLKEELKNAPLEFTDEAAYKPVVVKLPMPDGSIQNFAVVESPIMSPGLGEKFPSIKTYTANGIEDKSAILRFDITPKGFHAMILKADETVFIDPYSSLDTENYIVYNKSDFIVPEGKKMNCLAEDHLHYTDAEFEAAAKAAAIGEEMRTYRLAVATTIEYSNFHGGTVEGVMAAIVTTVNRVVGVYRRDLSINMILIEDNDVLVNIDSDSFSNNDAIAMLTQNAQFLNATIGLGAYDIGHVFSTGGGGIAAFGSVCQASFKAQGVTGTNSPIGDPFDIDYVSHEMGHQFGGNHTFNGNVGACNGNRVSTAAYEPGSGTTIMAYAGICGSHNIQNRSDAYFHLHSIREIEIYTQFQQGDNCPDITETGNTPPTVETAVSTGHTIPINTPFELIGSAEDAEGDSLTYCWEQRDLGFAGNPQTPMGNAPLFRSYSPTNSPIRTFPKMSDILNQVQIRGEILPSYTRGMEFTLAVRDNNPSGGGVASNFVELEVVEEAGPFVVTGPSEPVNWIGGESVLVEWDVAGTDVNPVNCAAVDIYFSIDEGANFDFVLAEGVTNDGTANVTLPEDLNLETTEGRIKIKGANNVFFNVNHSDITYELPKVEILTDVNQLSLCKGDQITVPVYVDITDGYESTVTLSLAGLPIGWTGEFSENPIEAPDTVDLVLTTGANSSGAFALNVNAFSNSLTTIPLAIEATILEESLLTTPPALQVPADGENLSQADETISFEWGALDGATEYAIEVATNPLFTEGSIVETFVGIPQASYDVPADTLGENQLYYWRVYANNNCQLGVVSEVFAFNLQEANSNNANPAIKEGDPFIVYPEELKSIRVGNLSIDDDNGPSDLVFTLKAVPQNGNLLLSGIVLEVGDAFTQKNINDRDLEYKHVELNNEDADTFLFDLTDGHGGFLYNQTFNIEIDYTYGSIEDIRNIGFNLFPNPATDLIQIEMDLDVPTSANFVLHNSAGQAVYQKNVDLMQGPQTIKMNIGSLPQGVYYYDFNSESFDINGKVLVIE